MSLPRAPLVNKMKFLTHARLTFANKVYQGRKAVSFTLQASVEGPNVPGSVLELWSGWMTRTHADKRWQCHMIIASKQRTHMSVSVFPCGLSKFLWFWFYCPILLTFLVFWLFLNFCFLVLNYFTEVWPTSIRLINLLSKTKKNFYIIQFKTRNIPAIFLQVESLFLNGNCWIKQIF